MLSMITQTIAFLGLYLSRDINVTTAFMFLFGVSSVGRCSISFLFLMELLPINAQVIASTCLQVNNSLVALFGCLYFWLIWKNWLGIEIFAGVLGVIAGIGAFFMPESPKFLISRHRYDEARDSINRIARYNNQAEFHDKFDREVEADIRRTARTIHGVNNSSVDGGSIL